MNRDVYMNYLMDRKYIFASNEQLLRKIMQEIIFGSHIMYNNGKTNYSSLYEYKIRDNDVLEINDILYGVKKVQFCDKFNQPIQKNMFSNTITNIIFSHSFNYPLTDCNNEKVLPTSLIKLEFGKHFNQTLKIGEIPHGVTNITFGNIHTLNVGVIPDSVKFLSFRSESSCILKEGVIPNSVIQLKYPNSCIEKGIIPNSVIELEFSMIFNAPLLEDMIPYGVKYIKFGRRFNNIFYLPNSVTNLSFGEKFNRPLKIGDIPNSVVYLSFGNEFNQPLEKGIIPDSVLFLRFGKNFNQPLNENNLPNKLIELIVDETYLFNEKINKNIIVGKIHKIKYSNSILYHKLKVRIDKNKLDKFHSYIIKNNEFKDILHKELIQNVYDPIRLKNITELFDVSFEELMENY